MTLQPPTHFRWEVAGKVATITLDRPERKNPLTFDSYAELRDTFRALALDPTHQGGGHHRCGRQFLLRRRCVRDHRAADPHENAGTARLHADDRRRGEGDASLSAARHCSGGGRVRGSRCDPGDGGGPPLRHRRQPHGVPVQPRRSGGLRHGCVRDPAAHHRSGPSVRIALHRPVDDRRGRRTLGLLQCAASAGTRAGRRPVDRRLTCRRSDLRARRSPSRCCTASGAWTSKAPSTRRRRRRRSVWRPRISAVPTRPSPTSGGRNSGAIE